MLGTQTDYGWSTYGKTGRTQMLKILLNGILQTGADRRWIQYIPGRHVLRRENDGPRPGQMHAASCICGDLLEVLCSSRLPFLSLPIDKSCGIRSIGIQ